MGLRLASISPCLRKVESGLRGRLVNSLTEDNATYYCKASLRLIVPGSYYGGEYNMGETVTKFKVFGAQGTVELEALIDTGATFTKILKSKAEDIGIDSKMRLR